jgi:3-oxoacyl-[acyl-carrier protein] reductase
MTTAHPVTPHQVVALDLRGRTALVTGAGSGIGRAVVHRLAAEGAAVAVNDSAPQRAAEVVAELQDAGWSAASAVGDIAGPDGAAAVVQRAHDAFGRLDILVNNAGLTRDAPIGRMTDEEFRLVHDVVLWGGFCMCRAAADLLRGPRGATPSHHRKVVNMASSVALYGAPGTVNYAAAKGGLVGLTKSLAREWARHRINVNAVAPGLITGTRLTDAKPPDLIAGVAEKVPLGRAGTPEDVAAAIAFLASPDADYITGQVLEIHGGLEVLA